MNQFKYRNPHSLPYEKCLRYGAKALSDVELLAVIIRNGTKNQDCLDVAETLLRLTGNQGLLGLKHLSFTDYKSIPGIGKVKALNLMCIAEICDRITKTKRADCLQFLTPADVADCYQEEMRHLESEQFRLLMLDTKSHLVHESVLSIGTVNYTCLSCRDIFREALRYGAVSIILLHNHPSGDPTPSKADIQTTRVVKEAGKLVGIPLIDHIVIGDPYYLSMKEQAYID